MSSAQTNPALDSRSREVAPRLLWQATLSREIAASLGPFEWVTFAYLAWLQAVLVLFPANVEHAGKYLLIHCGIAATITMVALMDARVPSNAVLRFIRSWYPLPLYIFFFEELQCLVHAIFPGWFDRWLIAFDYNFAQVHPSVWFAQFANPSLNDFMQFCYMTYFLYLVILPAILYLEKDRLAFWTVMTTTALAHYSVYVIAILFPIESPLLRTRAAANQAARWRPVHRDDRIGRAFRTRARRGVSLGACGRLDGCNTGGVALPPRGCFGFACRFSWGCASLRFTGATTMWRMCWRESQSLRFRGSPRSG